MRNIFDPQICGLNTWESDLHMIHSGNYSYSGKAPHVVDSVLFAILAGIAAAMVVNAIACRKFFSLGIPFILSHLQRRL